MTLDELFSKVCGFARERHAGQIREGSGEPYINHPMSVAAAFDLKTQPIEKLSAVLHDTIEDGGVTTAEIVALAGDDPQFRQMMKEVAAVVELLSHRPSPRGSTLERRRELYREALLRAKSNPHSRLVKIADLRDNLATLGELPLARQAELRFKYDGALALLEAQDNSTENPHLDDLNSRHPENRPEQQGVSHG